MDAGPAPPKSFGSSEPPMCERNYGTRTCDAMLTMTRTLGGYPRLKKVSQQVRPEKRPRNGALRMTMFVKIDNPDKASFLRTMIT